MKTVNKALIAAAMALLLMLAIRTQFRNRGDTVQLYGRSSTVFDDKIIRLPDGYFFDQYEKAEKDGVVYLLLKFERDTE